MGSLLQSEAKDVGRGPTKRRALGKPPARDPSRSPMSTPFPTATIPQTRNNSGPYRQNWRTEWRLGLNAHLNMTSQGRPPRHNLKTLCTEHRHGCLQNMQG